MYLHSCICICPMTAHCFPPRCWCGGACVARRPPPSSFRFISRRVPHFLIITAPMWTVLTQNWFTQHFPPAKNWLRTVFIFSPLKRFDRRQKLGEERIGTWSLKVKTKIYRSNTFLSVLVFFGPQFFGQGKAWLKIRKRFFPSFLPDVPVYVPCVCSA